MTKIETQNLELPPQNLDIPPFSSPPPNFSKFTNSPSIFRSQKRSFPPFKRWERKLCIFRKKYEIFGT